jgi:hypothetical protein
MFDPKCAGREKGVMVTTVVIVKETTGGARRESDMTVTVTTCKINDRVPLLRLR